MEVDLTTADLDRIFKKKNCSYLLFLMIVDYIYIYVCMYVCMYNARILFLTPASFAIAGAVTGIK